jgi:hypothetical protein
MASYAFPYSGGFSDFGMNNQPYSFGPNVMPSQFGPPSEALPPTGLTGPTGYPNSGTFTPTDNTGTTKPTWSPPNNRPYGPWSAPGYGTYTNPETMQMNLAQDARAWLSQNPQIWNAYSGQMTAGPTGLQTQARQNLYDFLGSDPSSYTRQGANIASGVSQFGPQNVTGGSFLDGVNGQPGLNAYMNPFMQNVVDSTMGDIERQRQIANQQGARSASASTYGGDRNALIEAETNRGFADIGARTFSQLRSQGFDTAAGLMGQDLSRGLQAQGMNQAAGLQNQGLRLGAAQAMGGFGNQMFNQGLQGASALNQFGTQDQMTQQSELDARYNDYMRSVYGPMQGYNFLGGLMSGTGYNAQSAGGPSRMSGFLGGAATGAGIGNMAFPGVGALVGGGLGGLLGMFG